MDFHFFWDTSIFKNSLLLKPKKIIKKSLKNRNQTHPKPEMHVTRRTFERGQQRAALAGVLTVLLPLFVILASGALANSRHWLRVPFA
jgi:hypothetical protein